MNKPNTQTATMLTFLNFQLDKRKCVSAFLGGAAWALLGFGMGQILGADFESQIMSAVCDATAGTLVWFALDVDKSPAARRAGAVRVKAAAKKRFWRR